MSLFVLSDPGTGFRRTSGPTVLWSTSGDFRTVRDPVVHPGPSPSLESSSSGPKGV